MTKKLEKHLVIGKIQVIGTFLTQFSETRAKKFHTFSVAPSRINDNTKKCAASLGLSASNQRNLNFVPSKPMANVL